MRTMTPTTTPITLAARLPPPSSSSSSSESGFLSFASSVGSSPSRVLLIDGLVAPGRIIARRRIMVLRPVAVVVEDFCDPFTAGRGSLRVSPVVRTSLKASSNASKLG